MENLPIPKLRSGWMAALLIALIIFVLYYVLAFEVLFSNVYEKQFDVVYFEQSQQAIGVWASIPRFYTSSEPAWVYLYVKNDGDNPVYDLEVYLIAESEDAETLLLPNLYEDEVYSSGAKFEVLAPGYVTTARVSFVSQEEPVISKVLLIRAGDGGREELGMLSPREFIRVNRSNIRALQHSFLETILLPPWSNGFILALVLFSVYLVNKIEEKKEPEPFGIQWWDLVWDTIVKSIKVFFGVTVVITMFLLINEDTASPIFCLVSLLVGHLLESGRASFYFSNNIIKLAIRFSYALAFVGVAASVLNLIASLDFLFPDLLSLKWMTFNSRTLWYGALVSTLVLLSAKWRTNSFFARSSFFWAYSFFSLSVVYVLSFVFKFYLDKNLRATFPQESVSWVALAIVSLLYLIYKRNTSRLGNAGIV